MLPDEERRLEDVEQQGGPVRPRVLVPVLRDRTLRSWPKFPVGGRVEYVQLSIALSREYSTDVHFAAYSVPSILRRLAKEALRQPDARSKLPDGVPVVLAAFDIDCPAAHAGNPGAADAWWLDEVEKITALLAKHPGGLVYRTRGGYRVIYLLPEPTILHDDADAEAWSLRYCSWIAYLLREFGIAADASCKDWTRLYRAPHATRDCGDTPEQRETIGDVGAIDAWIYEPTAEDATAARKLHKRRTPRERKESSAHSGAPVVAGEGLLAHAFRKRGWLGDVLAPGKWLAVCPNAAAHTKGEQFDGSTVLYAPGSGEEVGWVHCSHAHCQGRTIRDVLLVFSDAELVEARNAAGLARRPEKGPGGPIESGDATTHSAATEHRGSALPQIECGPDLHENTNAAERALAAIGEPRVYARARTLSVVARENAPKIRGVQRDAGAPFIHALEPAGLREHLSRAAEWFVWSDRRGEWKRGLPTGPVVAALTARGAWPLLPPLTGIVEVPTMRHDGSILEVPGYDEASGLLFDPRHVEFPHVPDNPTSAEIERAVNELREPFLEFEWERPDIDLPVVLALVLTLPARQTFQGTSPCFCFDSTTRGSGKGLACDVAIMAGSGRRPAVSILSADPEEQRKALFALALEGHRSILLDNIIRPLGGAVLSAALTSGEIRDRVLGVSRTAVAPFSAVLAATGNNLRFFGDFDRRVLVARQVPTVENPEDREPVGGFRHPDLRAWVAAEYPRFVAAALTILRGYFVAGRPPHGLKAFGSFEGWDEVVRGACIWSGLGDPLACRERIRDEADDDRARIQALLTSWYDAFGSSPATVADAVERSATHPELRHALAEFDSNGNAAHPNTTSIGRRIPTIVGRIVGQLRLQRVGKGSPVAYRVDSVGSTSSRPAEPEQPEGLEGLEGLRPSAESTGARARARARAYAEEPDPTPATPPTPWESWAAETPTGCECLEGGGRSQAPADQPAGAVETALGRSAPPRTGTAHG
jgi:hypothetical protein